VKKPCFLKTWLHKVTCPGKKCGCECGCPEVSSAPVTASYQSARP
jgi:hypothetical protein